MTNPPAKFLCNCDCADICPQGKHGSESRCELDLLPEPVVWGQVFNHELYIDGKLLASSEPLTAFFVEGKLTWLLTNNNSSPL